MFKNIIFQMTSKQPFSTPSKVTFFKHFPHHFLRPYDAQIQYSNADFLEKLTPRNCEWLMRPKIALSEAAQGLRQNWELIQNSELIDATMRETIHNMIMPISESLSKVDTKEKTTQATDVDIYNIMNSCYHHPELDTSIAKWMQESAALYVFFTQLRAMRVIFANPEQYASKLVSDTPEAIQFKNAKTIPALQKMLNAMCTTTTVTASATDMPHNRQQLSQQLTNPQRPSLSPAATSQGVPAPELIPPTAASLHTQPSPLTNQMMDIILQLQNQMQQMQSEAVQKANEEQEEEERSAKKQKKRKHCKTKQSSGEENTTTESAVHYDPDADVHGITEDATTSTPKGRKRKNRPVIIEDAEDEAKPTTSTAIGPTTETSATTKKLKKKRL